MKQLIYIAFLLFHSIGFGQDTLNVKELCSVKQGHWIYYGKDRPESGFPLEGKIEEGNYINDKKEGLWIKYHNDGKTIKFIGEYEHNRPKGNYSKYYDNGQLWEEGYFTKNQYHDSIIRYHRNGKREYAAFYDSLGKENGVVKYWLEDGTLEFEYEASAGIPISHHTIRRTAPEYYPIIYYATETKLPSFHACDNPAIGKETPPKVDGLPKTNGVKWQPDGSNKIYNDDNEIWQDGVFKNGQLWDGRLYVYDQDGILLKIKVFKSGLYHSDGQL